MLLIAFLLAVAQPAPGADRIVGLLSLPEVFGDGPCEKFTPEAITLYATPESRRVVGSIRVDRNWKLPECEGLTVNVHRSGIQPIREFPTREYAYEAQAAIVLQQRGRWFKVRLGDGAAWLRASGRDEYFPLERLITDGLTYLTPASDGRLRSSAGATPTADGERVASGRPVRVRGFRRLEDQLWVHVDVLSHSICESAAAPTVTAQGWMPAHAASGEPMIWFYSRGC